MRILGYMYRPVEKSYYVDGHEREDVVGYRNDYYLPTMEHYSLRMPLRCRFKYEEELHDSDKGHSYVCW